MCWTVSSPAVRADGISLSRYHAAADGIAGHDAAGAIPADQIDTDRSSYARIHPLQGNVCCAEVARPVLILPHSIGEHSPIIRTDVSCDRQGLSALFLRKFFRIAPNVYLWKYRKQRKPRICLLSANTRHFKLIFVDNFCPIFAIYTVCNWLIMSCSAPNFNFLRRCSR